MFFQSKLLQTVFWHCSIYYNYRPFHTLLLQSHRCADLSANGGVYEIRRVPDIIIAYIYYVRVTYYTVGATK